MGDSAGGLAAACSLGPAGAIGRRHHSQEGLMSTAPRRWSRSLVAALAVLMLVSAVPSVGSGVAHAQPSPPQQTHV